MRTAKVVIGAGFGDEGKGRIVDLYASQSAGNVLVVRHSGGANAGHTVVTPDGKRHVFGHFGSGTLAGASTYLSSDFVVNPLLWKKERAELAALGVAPRVIMSGMAHLTTPYEMMLNQFLEEWRFNSRHGSVGVGIHETMVRNKWNHMIVASLLRNKNGILPRTLQFIREEYVPRRISELGFSLNAEQVAMLGSDDVIDQYVAAAAEMMEEVEILGIKDAIKGDPEIIFEGSQGLLLDQRHPFFPHVTHASTGLDNVLYLCPFWGIEALEVTYVTRAYSTRHGEGPFPTHDPKMSFDDPTNAPNPWQGTMRFGPLDIDLIAEAIKADLAKVPAKIEVTTRLAVTCVDQVQGGVVPYRLYGRNATAAMVDDLVDVLCCSTRIWSGIITHGPKRDSYINFSLLEWTPEHA